jgi:hypothetical protein
MKLVIGGKLRSQLKKVADSEGETARKKQRKKKA